MKNEEYAFTVLDENGKEVECEVIVTFESDETGKNYIVYTDNTLDENGCTKVFASIFEPNSDDMVLQPIETEKEWANTLSVKALPKQRCLMQRFF